MAKDIPSPSQRWQGFFPSTLESSRSSSIHGGAAILTAESSLPTSSTETTPDSVAGVAEADEKKLLFDVTVVESPSSVDNATSVGSGRAAEQDVKAEARK
jgi:hypothetical protein